MIKTHCTVRGLFIGDVTRVTTHTIYILVNIGYLVQNTYIGNGSTGNRVIYPHYV